MKRRTTNLILSLFSTILLLGTASAYADHGKHGSRYDHHNQRHYDDQRYNKRDHARHTRYQRTDARRIKLDLPVRFRGSDKIRLRRLASRRYGIDLDNYHLVRVVVDGHGRRHNSTARLRVGPYYSPHKHLDGRTAFAPPRARRHADWVLGVNRSRVHNVRLVLEPRRHHVGGPYHRNAWIAEHGARTR